MYKLGTSPIGKDVPNCDVSDTYQLGNCSSMTFLLFFWHVDEVSLDPFRVQSRCRIDIERRPHPLSSDIAHNFEAIRRSMLGQETSIGALYLLSFGH